MTYYVVLLMLFDDDDVDVSRQMINTANITSIQTAILYECEESDLDFFNLLLRIAVCLMFAWLEPV